MKKQVSLVGLILVFVTSIGWAHPPVNSTSPDHNAVLNKVPANVTMTFAAPARVMKIVIVRTNGDTVQETRVEVPTRDMVTEIELTPEMEGVGTYTIQWRALGDDGHVLDGEWTFEVVE